MPSTCSLVLTLGYSGLRWGEVAALRVHHVDLARARIEVSQSVGEINGRIVVGTPKSHQTRWLPVPKLLLEGLEQQLAGKAPDDLVFPSPKGTFLRVANFRRGLLRPGGGVDWSVGSLPARAAAHSRLAGHRGRATVKSVQRMLGHVSATLTLDRYGHLFADELDDVAARLEDALRDADVVPMWSRADPTLFDSDGQESENGR